jgi:GNAT superfamily N-acetyltransferase
MSINISQLTTEDHPAWERLARGYREFYKTPTTDAEYDTAWQRLLNRDGLNAFKASQDGKVVGITHYLYHTSTWAPKVCYLQDLFTDESARGHGVARALINAVAADARAQQATRLFWLTQDNNHQARILYEKVAQYKGFVRYDFPL